MLKAALITFFLPLLADYNASLPPNPQDTTGDLNPSFTAASAESSHWINLLDQQQYGGAWLDSGPLLKDAVTEAEWIAAMVGTRKTYGNALSRKVGSHKVSTTLPYGTQGNFIIIYYNTQFTRNAHAQEVVTLMTDARGQWRAISYDIKPQQPQR